MKDSTKEMIAGILLGIVVVAFMTGLAFTLNRQSNNEKKERLKNYHECIEKTTDIEWCFNEFRPYILDR